MEAFDAVVIGAGVVGTATSYYLAREGLKVAVVDRGEVCSGTSGACDGNILVILKEPGPTIPLTLASIDQYKMMLDEIGDTFDFHQRGSTLIAEDDGDVKFCAQLMEKQIRLGLPVRWLDQRDIHSREPFLAPDIPGAIECDIDCSLNPMLATFAFARAAKQRGVVFKTNCPIRGIMRNSLGEISAVETANGSIATKNVIVCAGAWSGFVGKMVDVDIPITPRRGHILVLEQAPRVARRKISESKYAAMKYQIPGFKIDPEMEQLGISLVCEPVDDGSLLLGSSREFAGYDTKVSLKVVEAIAARGRRFLPVLERMHVIRTYVGLRPYSMDHLPIIGPVPQVPGFYVAAGHEGEGIGLAPITGYIIASYVTGREITDLPVSAVRYERFQKSATEKTAD